MDNNPNVQEPTRETFNRTDPRTWLSFARHIPPPGALYVTVDDIVLFKGWAATAAVTVNVSLRVLSSTGEIIPYFQAVVVAAGGLVPTLKVIPNMEGFILSATVATPTGPRGQVYVTLSIERGQGTGDATLGQEFLAGYPSYIDSPCFPQGVPTNSMDGRGFTRSILLGSGGSGGEVSVQVPAGLTWILRSFRAVFTTSAAAANRLPGLQVFDNSGNIFATQTIDVVIPAAQATVVSYAPGQTRAVTLNRFAAGFPMECRLAPLWNVSTITIALDALDIYTLATISVDQFVAQ